MIALLRSSNTILRIRFVFDRAALSACQNSLSNVNKWISPYFEISSSTRSALRSPAPGPGLGSGSSKNSKDFKDKELRILLRSGRGRSCGYVAKSACLSLPFAVSEVDEDEEWVKEEDADEWAGAAAGVMSAQVCGGRVRGGRMREPRMSLVTHCQVRERASE